MKYLPFIVLAIGAIVYLIGYNEYSLGTRVYAYHGTPAEIEEVRNRGGEHSVMEGGDQKKTFGTGIFIIGALWLVVTTIQGKKISLSGTKKE